MALRRVLVLCTAVVACATALWPAPASAKLECRQPNYVTRDGKIWAQDPQSPGTQTELTIRGVAWSGMEKENMIPDGLWDSVRRSNTGIRGTKVSTLLQFLSNHSINSVRLPLNAEYVIANPLPQLAYIHGWENEELTTWADPNAVRYFDLLGRVVQTLQDKRVSVLLDVHLLDKYLQDAYWYTAPYIEVTRSPAYRAAEYLAKAFCNATYWNILGLDLKDEMSDVQWNAESGDADPRTDWRTAASAIANRVIELCPTWLVFVGGASSPTDAQRFSVGADYKIPSSHWDGGNLHNATTRALNVSLATKIVLAPHAHAHGKLPQNYFFSADSNCTKSSPSDYFGLESDQLTAECVDFVNGTKSKTLLPCSTTEFGCFTYKHLTAEQIVANYKKVMTEAMGDVLKEGQMPVILGSFSGVYGAATQPHQTAALDFLIDFAASTLRGGYFWALNPDTEYFLEDSTNPGSGLFGKTHYGLFQTTSWQEPNADLLEALKKIPSSPIPCYGGKNPTNQGGSSAAARSTKSASTLAVLAGSLLMSACVFMW